MVDAIWVCVSQLGAKSGFWDRVRMRKVVDEDDRGYHVPRADDMYEGF